MSKRYPEIITDLNLNVSDETIRQDILATEAEIASLTRLAAAQTDSAADNPDPYERRLAAFKASARPHQIADRQAFVDYLRRLTQARAEAK